MIEVYMLRTHRSRGGLSRRGAIPLCVVLATGLAAFAAAPIGTMASAEARGPIVTRVAETGPSRHITGFRAYFNRPIARRRLRNVRNYTFYGVGPDGKRTRIGLRAAVPGLADRSVRVRVKRSFGQAQFRQLEIRLRGRKGGLADVKGRLIDGDRNRRAGGDGVFRFQILTGTSVRLRDHDGDETTVEVRGGGRADAIAPIGGPRTQHSQFWILDPIALRTTLSGITSKGTRGDGLVVIAEISGVRGVDFAPLSLVSGLRINTLTLPNNAVGL